MTTIFRNELNFIKGKRFYLPLFNLLIVLGILSLLNYYLASNDMLEGKDLARQVSTQMLSSSIVGLFFMIWLLQHYVHLFRCGYYSMLLSFGINRHQLFCYLILQITLYSLLFSMISFTACSVSGLFFTVWPWQLFMASDYNLIISMQLMLFGLGTFAALLSTIRWNHLLVLPLLFYWLLERWMLSLLRKEHEQLINYFPLKSFTNLVGSEILDLQQMLISTLYICIASVVLYRIIKLKALI
ncbi:hypothetical protein [Carboxylicivirga sp. N1Y90]|uniref:hypothetical protein n=1 Tax=Carboxylicivirga fragile TaxID=3417571 RepID=UPI003D3399D1|nr:hypothetical protein [Marinilabiliaceae bacterium N1Y90]